MLSGHIDTVPAGSAPWTRDPFGGEVDGNRLYGRGSNDIKAGIAATQKAELESRLSVAYDERFHWALGPSVACLLLSRVVRLRRRDVVDVGPAPRRVGEAS